MQKNIEIIRNSFFILFNFLVVISSTKLGDFIVYNQIFEGTFNFVKHRVLECYNFADVTYRKVNVTQALLSPFWGIYFSMSSVNKSSSEDDRCNFSAIIRFLLLIECTLV